ncbi:hypothetical protein JVT61DRAFT_10355 [Boletus reticuloceps]|uniref:Aminoglycoside phosphotransferase domain-containing protein n=1 Tax=Boletus reticuloceps TaxID=495285 RepID=A0A8I2YUS2_9AGAM|nr:hypothetical protein JVT61DRAFT_10355 [Boletus reticuloceps]
MLSDDKARRAFQYVGHMIKNKLVFLTIQEEVTLHICVKFMETYSTKAHQHLASLECAPELQGLQVIPSRWIMVMSGALNLQFVHGDIWDVNVMVSENNEFMFVNLNWSGRVGKAWYPD